MSKYKVTLCTVNYKCDDLLAKNLQYINRDNTDIDLTILITNNTKLNRPVDNAIHLPGIDKSTCLTRREYGFFST